MVEAAGCHGSGCRGRAPARGAGRECSARGFGGRPRMSMQRDMPLPSIQPARGWSGLSGAGTPMTLGVSGEPGSPECRCNGTRRCRASNPRRVGLGPRGQARPFVLRCRAGKRMTRGAGVAHAARDFPPLRGKSLNAPFPTLFRRDGSSGGKCCPLPHQGGVAKIWCEGFRLPVMIQVIRRRAIQNAATTQG
jgi:hypothetical protein